ncbi:MAG: hypothetical protein Harvfovirus5_24 [Harvfovirus sp.]|uniref:Uncharacterized protein n=1 Tax=Harvfovirus sp. TaxID=2487768 RepID=A0A3G5A0R2_9VIRU|nr:MAG: hypothetical protein Harvfovirus5_24 [Harvfovirus sp.]
MGNSSSDPFNLDSQIDKLNQFNKSASEEVFKRCTDVIQSSNSTLIEKANAHLVLGNMYIGNYWDQDFSKAIYHLTAARNSASHYGTIFLGMIHHLGSDLDKNKEYFLFYEYKCKNNLIWKKDTTTPLEKNYPLALELFQHIEKTAGTKKFHILDRFLGLHHEGGLATKINYDLAMKYYEKSSPGFKPVIKDIMQMFLDHKADIMSPECLEYAIKYSDLYYDGLFTLAKIYEVRGDIKSATKCCEKHLSSPLHRGENNIISVQKKVEDLLKIYKGQVKEETPLVYAYPIS